MNVPVMIGVVAFLAIAGSVVALWWWKIADRWEKEENRRFKAKKGDEPEEVTIRRTGGGTGR